MLLNFTMNFFALSFSSIDDLTFSTIVIFIKFKLSLLERSQASEIDFSSSVLVSVMAVGFSFITIARSKSIIPS